MVVKKSDMLSNEALIDPGTNYSNLLLKSNLSFGQDSPKK